MERFRSNVNGSVVALLLILLFLLGIFVIFVWYLCKRPKPEPEPHLVPLSPACLHPQVIDSLHTYRFREERKPRYCKICLAVFQNDEIVVQLPNCSHFFHVDCGRQWLELRANCPACRIEAHPQAVAIETDVRIN
jgi:hypothetical protein